MGDHIQRTFAFLTRSVPRCAPSMPATSVGCDDGQVLLIETRGENGTRHVGLLVDDSSH